MEYRDLEETKKFLTEVLGFTKGCTFISTAGNIYNDFQGVDALRHTDSSIRDFETLRKWEGGNTPGFVQWSSDKFALPLELFTKLFPTTNINYFKTSRERQNFIVANKEIILNYIQDKENAVVNIDLIGDIKISSDEPSL